MSTSSTNTLRSTSFPVNPLADNLRAIAEMASLYPCRSVLSIADALGVDLASIAPDLFDLTGLDCEAALGTHIGALSYLAGCCADDDERGRAMGPALEAIAG